MVSVVAELVDEKQIGMLYRIKTAEVIKKIVANGRNFPFGNNGKKCQDFSRDMFEFCGQALTKEEYLLITTSKKDMGERIERFTSNASFTSDMVENLPRKRGIIRKKKIICG